MADKRKKRSQGIVALSSHPVSEERIQIARKQLLADWCRLVGERIDPRASTISKAAAERQVNERIQVKLSPRLRQTLSALLEGASEKQIATQLKISPHTVHNHVKQLHRRFQVASRGELLSKFVPPRSADSLIQANGVP